jgi:hypothetical protein
MHGQRSRYLYFCLRVLLYPFYFFGLLLLVYFILFSFQNKRAKVSGMDKSCFTVYSANYFFEVCYTEIWL